MVSYIINISQKIAFFYFCIRTSKAMKDLRNALAKVENVLSKDKKTYLVGNNNGDTTTITALRHAIAWFFSIPNYKFTGTGQRIAYTWRQLR